MSEPLGAPRSPQGALQLLSKSVPVRPECSPKKNSEVLEEKLLYGEHAIGKLKFAERCSSIHGFTGVH